MTRAFSFTLKVILAASLLWAAPPRVLAAGVVGNGTPASCTEAALNAALAGGGTVTFNCGAAPHTILSSLAKSITVNTTIDGGGTITLDGQDSDRLFVVSNGAVLTLRNIVLAHGFGGDGGAIHNGSSGADLPGSVILENSTIRNSIASQSGGAIVSTGPLTITNSLLENNQALNGGALYPRFGGARTTIINSTLRYNTATDTTNGWGGALLVWDGASATIEGGEIFSNTARLGGGIYAFTNSSLTLSSGSLRDNAATNNGGGLYNTGVLTLTNTLLEDNRASSGGGLYSDGPQATLTGVTFNGNSALAGGGLFSNSGEMRLTSITLRGNVAKSRGGGIYNNGPFTYLSNVSLISNTVTALFGQPGAWGGGVYNSGNVIVQNATLSGNSIAFGSGGGLFNAGTANLINVTISGNSATYNGGGIGNGSGSMSLSHVTLSGNSAGVSGGGIDSLGGTVNVYASLVAASPAGGNCGGAIFNLGFNLSTDSSCGFNAVGDMLLGPLANNGGFTQTHLPQPGSPAIDFVAAGCPPPATDQRGGNRPVDGDNNGAARCDAGAVEYGAVVAKIYLPLVIR